MINYYDQIKWIKMDLEDVTDVYQAVEGIDFVYHSGAIVSFNKSDYDQMRKINIGGTTNIVNACLEHKVKKLAFISSVASIGRDGKSKYSEERYFKITKDLYQRLNDRLSVCKYLAGEEYTIADIATWPWIARHQWHDIGLSNYSSLCKWYEEISKREAVIKGYNFMGGGEIPKP